MIALNRFDKLAISDFVKDFPTLNFFAKGSIKANDRFHISRSIDYAASFHER
jgi:hypothetical protein